MKQMRSFIRHLLLAAPLLVTAALQPAAVVAQVVQPDWTRLEAETMQHFQAILRLDTSNPPGNEGLVVEYLDSVLKKEGHRDEAVRATTRRGRTSSRG